MTSLGNAEYAMPSKSNYCRPGADPPKKGSGRTGVVLSYRARSGSSIAAANVSNIVADNPSKSILDKKDIV